MYVDRDGVDKIQQLGGIQCSDCSGGETASLRSIGGRSEYKRGRAEQYSSVNAQVGGRRMSLSDSRGDRSLPAGGKHVMYRYNRPSQ